MLATLTDQPLLHRAGLPRLTRRVLVHADATDRTLARRDFIPWSDCSRLLARRRIAQDAQRLGVIVA